MDFQQKLNKTIQKNNSLLCIGLDPDITKLPKHLLKAKEPVFDFNKAIIDATYDLVCAYKPNIAFYSALGINGLKSLQQTIQYIHVQYTGIPVILDAKRGDIGNTSEKYTEEVFEKFNADAVTVNPYLGFDAIEPFLKHKNKGIIILCRTSNNGAADIQDTKVSIEVHLRGVSDRTPKKKFEPLYMRVARKVVEWNKRYKNCLMVVGATWPEELKTIRKLAPDMFFLIPGIGAQGGNLPKTLEYGLTKEKSGLIISVSRAILYASDKNDFAKIARSKAQQFRDEINKYL